MSQASLTVDSGSGLAVRTAINDAVQRLATKASGTSRPSDIAVFESWIETDNPGGGIATLWLWDGSTDIFCGLVNTTTHAFVSPSVLTTQGDLLYRGASSDARLGAAADAYQALFSGGPSAAPAWGGTWKLLGTATPANAATVAFTGIPADVNHINCLFDLTPTTNAVLLRGRTYGADGVVDTGGTDYQSQLIGTASNGGTALTGTNASYINFVPIDVARSISNDGTTGGIVGQMTFYNIQAARETRCTFDHEYVDTNNAFWWRVVGSGRRLEADRITGLQLSMSSGNLTGRVHLFGAK